MWSKVVIVGAGGAVGRALMDHLVAEGKASSIVATSRSGALKDLPAGVEVAKLDMTAAGAGAELATICAGAEICFCTLGLARYEGNHWLATWPLIADALVEGCKGSGAALIFMDNLYVFHDSPRMPLKSADVEFTATPKRKKPWARVLIARRLLAAHEAGDCQVALVRASDFYGPRTGNSMLGFAWDSVVVSKATPILIGNPNKIHCQAYVPDVAVALAAVAEKPEAWGRAYHVPSAPAISMKAWLSLILKANDMPGADKPKYRRIDGALLAFLSLFVKDVRELKAMIWAWRNDYTVSSADFDATFPDFTATPLDVAVKATNDYFLKMKQDKDDAKKKK